MEYIHGVRLSHWIGVPIGLVFEGVGRDHFDIARITQSDNAKDGLTLQPDPDLTFVVERSMDASHVQIDQHTPNVPPTSRGDNRAPALEEGSSQIIDTSNRNDTRFSRRASIEPISGRG